MSDRGCLTFGERERFGGGQRVTGAGVNVSPDAKHSTAHTHLSECKKVPEKETFLPKTDREGRQVFFGRAAKGKKRPSFSMGKDTTTHTLRL